ncbi:MAG: tol-pal system YbgF family protein [Sandaracinaceae bacterium]
MSVAELHPEDLLDRLQAGALNAGERAMLDAHCATCMACAIEREARADATAVEVTSEDRDLALALIDRALIDRAMDDRSMDDRAMDDRAMDDRAMSGADERSPMRAAGGATRTLAIAAAALLAIVTSGGLAYAAVRAGWLPDPFAPEVPAVDVPPAPTPRTAPRDEATNDPATSVQVPSVEVPSVEVPSVEVPSDEPASGAPEPTRVEPRPEAPDELYARANAARRGGDARRALALYRELTGRYPRSREAQAARVAAGNLALHELHDARTALSQFDAYLASSPNGDLSLEARVGKALALGRLGRRTAERRAWQDVLDHHPASVHAERARQRISELE